MKDNIDHTTSEGTALCVQVKVLKDLLRSGNNEQIEIILSNNPDLLEVRASYMCICECTMSTTPFDTIKSAIVPLDTVKFLIDRNYISSSQMCELLFESFCWSGTQGTTIMDEITIRNSYIDYLIETIGENYPELLKSYMHNREDSDYTIPFIIAVLYGFESPEKIIGWFKRLLHYGCKVEQTSHSKDGNTANEQTVIELAVNLRDPEFVKYCIDLGAVVNKFEYEERYHHFGENIALRMLRLNATTKNPENIIKITQILQILINHGLNMHYVNMFGQNIADYVQIFGWNDTSVQSIIVGVVPTGIINENVHDYFKAKS